MKEDEKSREYSSSSGSSSRVVVVSTSIRECMPRNGIRTYAVYLLYGNH